MKFKLKMIQQKLLLDKVKVVYYFCGVNLKP